MTKAHRTLSDSESQRLVEARQRIMVQIIIVGLMLWGASAGLGAQPVETSQLPKKVLPNDPVGNLFNDGPRVVYTQDAGADPIEKLFWDREQLLLSPILLLQSLMLPNLPVLLLSLQPVSRASVINVATLDMFKWMKVTVLLKRGRAVTAS